MTLRVGDRVRLTANVHGHKVGTEFTIQGKGEGPFDWEVSHDAHGRYALNSNEVEKIGDQPTPLGLRVGDKVVNLKTGREGLVLKGPISGELKVYDTKPPIRDAVPAQALEEYEHWHPGTYDVWRRVTVKPKPSPW